MSWLHRYLDYTKNQESPELFHLWVGLTILSSALGRRVYIDRGYYTLYPNLFTVLVAGSAACKKSTAIDMGVKLLEDIPEILVRSGMGSTEKFVLSSVTPIVNGNTPPTTFIHADELSVFVTRDHQGEKMMNVLTQLYNCPKKFEFDTVKHGKQVMHLPCVVVLSGTQPTTLNKILPDNAFGGGFASRILFIYQEEPRAKNAWPELDSDETALKTSLRSELLEIAKLEGPFTPTPAAKKRFKDYYESIKSAIDPKLDGFLNRKGDHVLRVAQLLSTSFRRDLILDEPHVDAAITAIEGVQTLMGCVFDSVGNSGQVDKIDRLVRIMQHFTRMQHSELMRRTYRFFEDGDDFKRACDYLIAIGAMHRDPTNHTIYVWDGLKKEG